MKQNSQTKHYQRTLGKKAKQFNKHSQLRDYFGPLIGDKKHVTIAELASGPVNTIGDEWPDVDVDVICSDKYARAYEALWEELGETPLIPIQTEDMEELRYADNIFDIVHCENALDHTKNPYKAVEEMQRVCKKGGWVYLRHAESQKDIYGGHHHYNMEDLSFDGFTRVREGKWILDTWQKK